jgi:hypothetical protein
MAKKRKPKNNWKGGSFKAALGGYLRKKLKNVGKNLKKSAKKALW